VLEIQDGGQITEVPITLLVLQIDNHVAPKTIRVFMTVCEKSKSPAIMEEAT